LTPNDLPCSSIIGLPNIGGMLSVCKIVGELPGFSEILFDLVVRSLSGVARNCKGLVFPASGDDASVDTLVLVLRTRELLISCSSFLALLFLKVTLPLRGVTLRRSFVVEVICDSSSLFSLP